MKNITRWFAAVVAAAAVTLTTLASSSAWVEVAPGNTRLDKRYLFSATTDTDSTGAQIGSANVYTTEFFPAPSENNSVLLDRSTVFSGGTFPTYLKNFFLMWCMWNPVGGPIAGDSEQETFLGHYAAGGPVIYSYTLTYKRGTSVLYTVTKLASEHPSIVDLFSSERSPGVGVWSHKGKSANLIPGAPSTNVTLTQSGQTETISVWRAASYAYHLATFGYNNGSNTPNAGQNVMMQICDLGTYSPGTGWITNLLVFCPSVTWPTTVPGYNAYDFGNYVVKVELPL